MNYLLRTTLVVFCGDIMASFDVAVHSAPGHLHTYRRVSMGIGGVCPPGWGFGYAIGSFHRVEAMARCKSCIYAAGIVDLISCTSMPVSPR